MDLVLGFLLAQSIDQVTGIATEAKWEGTMRVVQVGILTERGDRELTTLYKYQCETGLAQLYAADGVNLDTGAPVSFRNFDAQFRNALDIVRSYAEPKCQEAQ